MSRVHLRRFVVSQLKCLVVAAPLILIVGGPTGPTPAVAQDSVDRDRQPVFTAGEVAQIVTGRFASDLRYAAGGIERTLDRAEYKPVRASRVELVEKLRAAATAAETFKDTKLTEAKLKDAQKVLAVALREASETAGNAQAQAGNARQAVDAKAQELAAAERQLGKVLQQACACVENFGWARTPQSIQAADGLLQSAIYRSGLVAQSVGLLALNTVQPTASLLASDLRQSAQAIEQTIPKITDKAQAAAQQDLCNKLRQAADSCDAMNNVPQADMAKVHQTLATALADAGKAVAKVEGLKGDVLNKVDKVNKLDKVEDSVEHHLAVVESRLGQILRLASACCAERAIANTQQTIASAERDLFRTVRWTADAARDLACCATGTIASVEGQLACQVHNAVFQLERTIDSTKDKALATARQALCDDLRLAAQLADKATNTAKSEVAKVHQTLATALADAGKAVAKVEGLKGDVLNKVDGVED
ncbi:MAG: hypothetical protein HY290_31205, partial [Planctomycetia bacterium]|nr:hypothetical protein [Planctomycetia bacterium]